MANIEIGGRLHSTATGNVVTGANEVLDDTKNKKQSVINAEVDETIGDDNTAGTIKGRIKTAEGKLDTLNGDSSTSGSVAKAVADAKTELIGGATSNGNTLKKVEDRTATLETAVGSNGSVDQRIAAAKSEVIGDAASDYNTLGKLEDKIQAEASARESAVSTEAQARQDAITAETNRATTRENQIYDLVHTPEQHYVTVATYADLANIASPSDDTIYRVSSYNGKTSQVDNTVYSEYGYDGTNFVFLCVKSQIDEVYDISAHHSNNTYVDLAAALDGGNNIPQSLQKGGMSVKFVQSSDNKYIQARCMAQNFTTDVTQWQGVDSKPVDGSHNLLESNGAAPFNSLMPNGYKFYGRIQGYLDSNGTFHSGGTYNCTDYISVTPGIVVTIKEYYDAGTNVAFGYSDKNGSNPVVLLQATSGLLEKDILIPEGVNYVRAWGRNSQEVSIVVDLYTIDSFNENALFDLSRATSTLTPNALVATKELLISNYVPSVKIIVPDQGNDVLFDGNFIIGKVSDNSLNVIYSGSINQNTNGRGYIIFTPKIKYTNELNGANIFVSCKGRYIGYSARQADIGANHTLTYSNGVVSEVQTFICGISFIRYTDKSIYTLYQDNNWEEVENVNPEEQDIKTLIESGGTIYLGDKTYIINESISVPTDTHIIGSAKTIIKSNISTPCFIINGADNVKFENITFYGADSYTKPSIPTENDIKNKTGIGAKIGIEFQNISNKAVVSNCIFKNFDNSAIHLRNDNGGSANVDGVKVSNCFFDNCFIGVFADKRYEYCQFTDSSFNKCQIGAWCEAGNNIFNSCHFDTNRCGFVLSGLLNSNEAHSNVGACSFNHNAVCSLFIINVDNAEAFNNCSFFDGKMYIENSYGIIISSSLIAQDAVEIHGGNLIELPKYLSFCNNVFSKSYGFDGFINPDNLSLILKNNFYLDGSNSDNINN